MIKRICDTLKIWGEEEKKKKIKQLTIQKILEIDLVKKTNVNRSTLQM